jgi:two-component system CheB/CheR fusion protein
MPQPLPPNAPLVLLVDDHADTVGLMARLLRGQGFDVLKADSVKTAVSALDGRPIDLLISDLSLPDGTGLDVIRQLHQRMPNLRAIAVSGHGSDADRQASLTAGFARHVTKPIDFEKFVAVCREVLGGK